MKNLQLEIGGVGIGNGWISSKYQAKIAEFTHNLGLINEPLYNELKKNEKNIDEQIKENNQEYASNFWQHGLNQMLAKTGITNIYDLSNPFRDMTEENFWHFLQKSHVRKSIHVGGIKFKDGKNVSTNI